MMEYFNLANLVVAVPMPPPDPLGFPLPPWIMQALSYLTLTFHLLAMNFTIGACLLMLWSYIRKPTGYKENIYFLGTALPLGMSYIITLGIPPLLFVQVLYGQLFYSSSILLGAFWIQVIPLVILAYSHFYYHKLKRDRKPQRQWLVITVALAALLYVGYIYVNNLTLTMTPEKWQALYAAFPGGGTLNHGEPTVHPRFLLFLSGSFAVAGLALIWRGSFLNRWGLTTEGIRSQKTGFKSFLISPVLWVIAAIGVYATRPADITAMFTASSATVPLLIIGIVSVLIAGLFAFLSQGKSSILLPLLASVGAVGAMGSMVIFRDLVRQQALKPYFQLSSVPVHAQWGMFAIFVVSLLLGLGLLIVLMIKVFPKMAEASRERLNAATAAK